MYILRIIIYSSSIFVCLVKPSFMSDYSGKSCVFSLPAVLLHTAFVSIDVDGGLCRFLISSLSNYC